MPGVEANHRPIAMEAQGEAGAAQPIAADEAAGVHDAPRDLPEVYLSPWKDWNNAKYNMFFERDDKKKKLVLKQGPSLLVT